MKDYSAISDFEINKQVATALGASPYFSDSGDFEKSISQGDESVIIKSNFKLGAFDPCNNPSDAWPIITNEGISLLMYTKGRRSAYPAGKGLLSQFAYHDENPLRAAMIVFLMMKDEAVNTQGEKV